MQYLASALRAIVDLILIVGAVSGIVSIIILFNLLPAVLN